MTSEARAKLAEGAAAIGLPLSPAQLETFDGYAALLAAGKREFNLTALTDPVGVAIKHFLDSLSVLLALPPGPLSVIDIGTGAGFPGLPLKIARPELDVVLVEATAKKATWVQQTVAALGLVGARGIPGRAEEVAHHPAHRGRYDAAVARAVAPLPVLCELCLPFLRPGGLFVALKTVVGVDTELPKTGNALATLGARCREVRRVDSPLLPNRVLAVFEQLRPAPQAYPRRAGMPAKRPL